MFTVEERDRARDRVLELARTDKRLVAAAFVGSLADETGQGDRWSDIDLTFALDNGVSMEEVLADWTGNVQKELKAVHLFDLPYQSTVYRVFLLPHALQMDLSFMPRKDFRPWSQVQADLWTGGRAEVSGNSPASSRVRAGGSPLGPGENMS